LQKEKQREVDRLLHGDVPLSPERSDDVQPAAAPAPEVKKIKISLRGAWGTYKISVPIRTTGIQLAEVYCDKSDRDVGLAKGVRLMFDGDKIGAEETLEDLDMDDGDQIDVEV
jgi:hypothetical protein